MSAMVTLYRLCSQLQLGSRLAIPQFGTVRQCQWQGGTIGLLASSEWYECLHRSRLVAVVSQLIRGASLAATLTTGCRCFQHCTTALPADWPYPPSLYNLQALARLDRVHRKPRHCSPQPCAALQPRDVGPGDMPACKHHSEAAGAAECCQGAASVCVGSGRV